MITTPMTLSQAVRRAAHPLGGAPQDHDPLLAAIGGARIVLLGEASHGTHEFYRERAVITKRLIEEKGFTAVAVEADWPDAYRVNRFVRGADADASAVDALGGFRRFPAWMWRNADVLDFIGWLRAFNEDNPGRSAGFYGLDLYSLYTSIEEVLHYLDRVDPDAAARARQRYGCFGRFGEDTEAYGYAMAMGATEPCEEEVTRQLLELRRRAPEYARGSPEAEDELFYAEQNARLIANAERYYRTMFWGNVASWNLRDRHMHETLEALLEHLSKRGQPAKLVVWAHNSHLGDARATEMGARGELNLGQLVRERHGREAFALGFTTYEGTVTAASDWGGPAERKRVRPALSGSYEEVFHGADLARFLLLLGALGVGLAELAEPRLERAIGVIYRPETERVSHYFRARLPAQFDAILHIDKTRAVEPLERTAPWETGEPPETYPMAV